MDITKAQFENVPNVAGRETFSYAELLAQLNAESNAGKGADITAFGPTIPDGPITPLDFSGSATVNFDDLNFVQLGVDTAQFIIPANVARVQLWVDFEWNSSAVGIREIRTFKNGASAGNVRFKQAAQAVGTVHGFMVSQVFDAVEGDRFGFAVTQDSGGNLDVDSHQQGITVLR